MIFNEPTPYILGLLEKGFLNIKSELDIIFLVENVSQSWNINSSVFDFNIARSKEKYILLLRDIFLKRKYKLIHVAGWSRLKILLIILLSRIFFIPVAVESDTPLNSEISVWKKIIKKCLYPVLFKFPVFFLPGGMRQANYLNHYGVRSKKIVNAQMTVDIEHIQNSIVTISAVARDQLRLDHDVAQQDIVFLYVGRLLDWKGIRELIAALKLMKNTRAKLWIVGGGELTDEVQLETRENMNITYFGRISGDLLWPIYHAADVLVLPSYWEPWGLVVNEAMAVGKPAIVTETVGCIDDLVLNLHTGLVVPPKSITALSDAMRFMLENPEKIKSMAENAKKHIARWTLQNEASNIIVAWEKVLLKGN